MQCWIIPNPNLNVLLYVLELLSALSMQFYASKIGKSNNVDVINNDNTTFLVFSPQL